jgi:hypothetical protein
MTGLPRKQRGLRGKEDVFVAKKMSSSQSKTFGAMSIFFVAK